MTLYGKKIASDFQFAVNTLPAKQADPGRANQLAAKAYLAKVRLYEAYRQDENNNVASIDPALLNEVVTLTSDVINSGQYQLNDDSAKKIFFMVLTTDLNQSLLSSIQSMTELPSEE